MGFSDAIKDILYVYVLYKLFKGGYCKFFHNFYLLSYVG